MDAKNTWDFLLVLDRPVTPQDEEVFDFMPEFADGKVSLLLTEGEPTVLVCDDMEAPRLEQAVEAVTRNIGKINGLRVISVQPKFGEDD
jgi:hypothetical protein